MEECTAGQAIDDDIMRRMRYRDTLRTCNNHCSLKATVVTPKRLNAYTNIACLVLTFSQQLRTLTHNEDLSCLQLGTCDATCLSSRVWP